METSSATSMENSARTTSLLPVSFPHPISSKLDNKNFLVWWKQVLTMLRGHKLQFFLSESMILPSKFLFLDDEHQQLANPKFQDCMGTTGPTHHVMDPCIHIRCSSNTFGKLWYYSSGVEYSWTTFCHSSVSQNNSVQDLVAQHKDRWHQKHCWSPCTSWP